MLLAALRGAPLQQLLCVYNPVSGSGQAPAVANALSESLQSGFRLSENRYDVTLLETVPDRGENVGAIGQEITRLAGDPRPLTVLCLGGDGTFDLVVSGYLSHLFGSLKALPDLEVETIHSGLEKTDVRLGIVPVGSANDISGLYGGPRPKPSAIAKYLSQGVDSNLHLGMALVTQEAGTEVWPFVHSFAAGCVFTPVLVDARSLRGGKAMWQMLRNGIGRILRRSEPRVFHWKRSDGTSGEFPGLDALTHALPRIAKAVGIAGLPSFEGLGFKVVPETGMAARLLIGAEIFGSGMLSRIGLLAPLFEGARVMSVPKTHQQKLDVGEWLEFWFTDAGGETREIGYQISGDGIGYTRRPVRVVALPPIGKFLMTPGAPMAQLLWKNVMKEEDGLGVG